MTPLHVYDFGVALIMLNFIISFTFSIEKENAQRIVCSEFLSDGGKMVVACLTRQEVAFASSNPSLG